MEQDEPISLEQTEKEKKKKKKGDKSVGVMFRNLMSNHLQASALADRKASLMVSINALIISITTSFLVHDFTKSQPFLLPAILLLFTCLSSITFAILATRPTAKTSYRTIQLQESHNIDLLFFCDYTQLNIDEYLTAMQNIMSKEPDLREKMLRNFYAQGQVLVKKYRRLKMTYSIFMFGFPVAVIWFIVELLCQPL